MIGDYFKSHIPEFNINNTLFVARPGLIFILGSLILFLLFWCLGVHVLRDIFFVILLFVVWFFRDPHRETPPPGFAVSPADGTIIRLDKSAKDPITGQSSIKISIFMSIFSVHVNRVPVAGTLVSQDYHEGSFLNASFDKASSENERNVLIIEDESKRRIAVVQIAGLIARRILSWVKPGDELTRGQRFGMIRFGSRVDIFIPTDSILMVSLGQPVKAGLSPLWRYPDE
ncbi:MAG: phosphatidylserine decarboxylase family protein [Deltaproteobacteria bacterium]|nr:phosphatidylserine decarboxylase family protein [Deltaproteobacteria bacterium]